jgi:hypothetical protein
MNRRPYEQLADTVLDGVTDTHIVVGPLRWWQSSDGSRDLCFAVTRLLANRPRTTWVHVPDEIDRLRLIIALLRGPPLVVHVTEDERDWARLCERLFDEQGRAQRSGRQ